MQSLALRAYGDDVYVIGTINVTIRLHVSVQEEFGIGQSSIFLSWPRRITILFIAGSRIQPTLCMFSDNLSMSL